MNLSQTLIKIISVTLIASLLSSLLPADVYAQVSSKRVNRGSGTVSNSNQKSTTTPISSSSSLGEDLSNASLSKYDLSKLKTFSIEEIKSQAAAKANEDIVLRRDNTTVVYVPMGPGEKAEEVVESISDKRGRELSEVIEGYFGLNEGVESGPLGYESYKKEFDKERRDLEVKYLGEISRKVGEQEGILAGELREYSLRGMSAADLALYEGYKTSEISAWSKELHGELGVVLGVDSKSRYAQYKAEWGKVEERLLRETHRELSKKKSELLGLWRREPNTYGKYVLRVSPLLLTVEGMFDVGERRELLSLYKSKVSKGNCLEAGCVDEMYAVMGIGMLGSRSDGGDVRRLLINSMDIAGSGALLMAGAGTLLSLGAYSELDTVVGYATREERKQVSGDYDLLLLSTYAREWKDRHGKYLGKKSVNAAYPIDRTSMGNAWTQVVDVLLAEGSAESLSILSKYSVGACGVRTYMGARSVGCSGVMPFIAEGLLSGKVKVDLGIEFSGQAAAAGLSQRGMLLAHIMNASFGDMNEVDEGKLDKRIYNYLLRTESSAALKKNVTKHAVINREGELWKGSEVSQTGIMTTFAGSADVALAVFFIGRMGVSLVRQSGQIGLKMYRLTQVGRKGTNGIKNLRHYAMYKNLSQATRAGRGSNFKAFSGSQFKANNAANPLNILTREHLRTSIGRAKVDARAKQLAGEKLSIERSLAREQQLNQISGKKIGKVDPNISKTLASGGNKVSVEGLEGKKFSRLGSETGNNFIERRILGGKSYGEASGWRQNLLDRSRELSLSLEILKDNIGYGLQGSNKKYVAASLITPAGQAVSTQGAATAEFSVMQSMKSGMPSASILSESGAPTAIRGVGSVSKTAPVTKVTTASPVSSAAKTLNGLVGENSGINKALGKLNIPVSAGASAGLSLGAPRIIGRDIRTPMQGRTAEEDKGISDFEYLLKAMNPFAKEVGGQIVKADNLAGNLANGAKMGLRYAAQRLSNKTKADGFTRSVDQQYNVSRETRLARSVAAIDAIYQNAKASGREGMLTVGETRAVKGYINDIEGNNQHWVLNKESGVWQKQYTQSGQEAITHLNNNYFTGVQPREVKNQTTASNPTTPRPQITTPMAPTISHQDLPVMSRPSALYASAARPVVMPKEDLSLARPYAVNETETIKPLSGRPVVNYAWEETNVALADGQVPLIKAGYQTAQKTTPINFIEETPATATASSHNSNQEGYVKFFTRTPAQEQTANTLNSGLNPQILINSFKKFKTFIVNLLPARNEAAPLSMAQRIEQISVAAAISDTEKQMVAALLKVGYANAEAAYVQKTGKTIEAEPGNAEFKNIVEAELDNIIRSSRLPAQSKETILQAIGPAVFAAPVAAGNAKTLKSLSTLTDKAVDNINRNKKGPLLFSGVPFTSYIMNDLAIPGRERAALRKIAKAVEKQAVLKFNKEHPGQALNTNILNDPAVQDLIIESLINKISISNVILQSNKHIIVREVAKVLNKTFVEAAEGRVSLKPADILTRNQKKRLLATVKKNGTPTMMVESPDNIVINVEETGIIDSSRMWVEDNTVLGSGKYITNIEIVAPSINKTRVITLKTKTPIKINESAGDEIYINYAFDERDGVEKAFLVQKTIKNGETREKVLLTTSLIVSDNGRISANKTFANELKEGVGLIGQKLWPVYGVSVIAGFSGIATAVASMAVKPLGLSEVEGALIQAMGYLLPTFLSIPIAGLAKTHFSRKVLVNLGFTLIIGALTIPMLNGMYGRLGTITPQMLDILLISMVPLGLGATMVSVTSGPIMQESSTEGKFRTNYDRTSWFKQMFGIIIGNGSVLIGEQFFGLDMSMLFPMYAGLTFLGAIFYNGFKPNIRTLNVFKAKENQTIADQKGESIKSWELLTRDRLVRNGWLTTVSYMGLMGTVGLFFNRIMINSMELVFGGKPSAGLAMGITAAIYSLPMFVKRLTREFKKGKGSDVETANTIIKDSKTVVLGLSIVLAGLLLPVPEINNLNVTIGDTLLSFDTLPEIIVKAVGIGTTGWGVANIAYTSEGYVREKRTNAAAKVSGILGSGTVGNLIFPTASALLAYTFDSISFVFVLPVGFAFMLMNFGVKLKSGALHQEKEPGKFLRFVERVFIKKDELQAAFGSFIRPVTAPVKKYVGAPLAKIFKNQFGKGDTLNLSFLFFTPKYFTKGGGKALIDLTSKNVSADKAAEMIISSALYNMKNSATDAEKAVVKNTISAGYDNAVKQYFEYKKDSFKGVFASIKPMLTGETRKNSNAKFKELLTVNLVRALREANLPQAINRIIVDTLNKTYDDVKITAPAQAAMKDENYVSHHYEEDGYKHNVEVFQDTAFGEVRLPLQVSLATSIKIKENERLVIDAKDSNLYIKNGKKNHTLGYFYIQTFGSNLLRIVDSVLEANQKFDEPFVVKIDRDGYHNGRLFRREIGRTERTVYYKTENNILPNIKFLVDNKIEVSAAQKLILLEDGSLVVQEYNGATRVVPAFDIRLRKEEIKHWAKVFSTTPNKTGDMQMRIRSNYNKVLPIEFAAADTSNPSIGVLGFLKGLFMLPENLAQMIPFFSYISALFSIFVNPFVERYGKVKVLKVGQYLTFASYAAMSGLVAYGGVMGFEPTLIKKAVVAGSLFVLGLGGTLNSGVSSSLVREISENADVSGSRMAGLQLYRSLGAVAFLLIPVALSFGSNLLFNALDLPYVSSIDFTVSYFLFLGLTGLTIVMLERSNIRNVISEERLAQLVSLEGKKIARVIPADSVVGIGLGGAKEMGALLKNNKLVRRLFAASFLFTGSEIATRSSASSLIRGFFKGLNHETLFNHPAFSWMPEIVKQSLSVDNVALVTVASVSYLPAIMVRSTVKKWMLKGWLSSEDVVFLAITFSGLGLGMYISEGVTPLGLTGIVLNVIGTSNFFSQLQNIVLSRNPMQIRNLVGQTIGLTLLGGAVISPIMGQVSTMFDSVTTGLVVPAVALVGAAAFLVPEVLGSRFFKSMKINKDEDGTEEAESLIFDVEQRLKDLAWLKENHISDNGAVGRYKQDIELAISRGLRGDTLHYNGITLQGLISVAKALYKDLSVLAATTRGLVLKLLGLSQFVKKTLVVELSQIPFNPHFYRDSVFTFGHTYGTGYVIKYKGQVYGVTNARIGVAKGNIFNVYDTDWREYKVGVISSGAYTPFGGTYSTNVALVKFLNKEDEKQFKPLLLGSSDAIEVGDEVFTVGVSDKTNYVVEKRNVEHVKSMQFATSHVRSGKSGLCGGPVLSAKPFALDPLNPSYNDDNGLYRVVGLNTGTQFEKDQSYVIRAEIIEKFLEEVISGVKETYPVMVNNLKILDLPYDFTIYQARVFRENSEVDSYVVTVNKELLDYENLANTLDIQPGDVLEINYGRNAITNKLTFTVPQIALRNVHHNGYLKLFFNDFFNHPETITLRVSNRLERIARKAYRKFFKIPKENRPVIKSDKKSLMLDGDNARHAASAFFYKPVRASGTVIKYNGTIYGLMTAHCDNRVGKTVKIADSNGNEYAAQIIAAGKNRFWLPGAPDVTILALSPEAEAAFTPIELSDTDPKEGDELYSYGYVRVNDFEGRAILRTVLGKTASRVVTTPVMANGSVGYCGASLVDEKGYLVGMHAGTYNDKTNSHAVNLETIKTFLDYMENDTKGVFKISLEDGTVREIPLQKVVAKHKKYFKNLRIAKKAAQKADPLIAGAN
ncbi:hypothetical protein AAIR98_001081 [Elusimicrobium simillimum]|uniref:trypsin-like peptidase domain-containing protein n=1 Tax=Elusimicrobium simillimum TaxID=3143438 RepID=UPI003C6F0485